MGPTSVLPASQYYTSRKQAERKDEALLCGDAGAVTIVHYDLWHRATTNRSDRNRFMIKFLFCRMAEPTAPQLELFRLCMARSCRRRSDAPAVAKRMELAFGGRSLT